MKAEDINIGDLVKWHTDTAHFSLVGGIVIDTCIIDGLPHATVFWFDLGSGANNPYYSLTTISRA